MEKVKYLILPLLYALLAGACSIDHFDDARPEEGTFVRFHIESLDKDGNTRATGTTLNGGSPLTTMAIYAAYTTDSWTDVAPLNYMTRQLVSRPGANQPWSYTPEQLWPGSGYLSFFAYAPYDASGVSISATSGIPRIDFTVNTAQDQQVDLLVAKPVFNQSKASAATAVTIPMRHALTKIGFSARMSNAPAADTQVLVTKIEITGLYANGTYPMDGNEKSWSGLNDNTKTFSVQNSDGSILSKPLTEVYDHLSSDNGYLLLLPQTVHPNAKVKVHYNVTTASGTEQKEFEIQKLSDAISQFRPGEAYNFMFTIENGISFIVAPVDWTNMRVNADIKNRILNVTRIEANVYDAAVTRIYFWSNQPKDAVKLETTGRTGNALNGTEFRVDDIYQTLSGTSTGSNNLIYRGIDEILPVERLEKGEGYLDVIHRSDITPNQVTAPNHIFLNAAGLIRSIKLQSHKSSDYDSDQTPYIGTFHRRNEIGERLIRWGVTTPTDTWTAEVMHVPSVDENNASWNDYADVLIDRWPSPAMTDGSLYSNLPLHHEKCLVEGQYDDWLNQKVKGVGTIYFRVGWKSTAPSNRVRYARIKVTLNKSTDYILHLRQGHSDDYVIPPSYGGNRPNAVKWSPYNVQAQPTVTRVTSASGRRNPGDFMKYPTQAGMFYQWTNETNPGKGYAPQGTQSALGTPYDDTFFWNRLSMDHETCPNGYRRPVSGNTSAVTNAANHLDSEFKQSLIDSPVAGKDQNIGNSVWGYYADGFFDRRMITHKSQTSPGNDEVAYIGRLFYNNNSLASLFFPAGGYRVPNGTLYYENANPSTGDNNWGVYLSASVSSTASNSIHLKLHKSGIAVDETAKRNAISLRCVRDIPFSTELVDWDQSYTPVILEYNSHAYTSSNPLLSAINYSTVTTVMNNMMLDINKLPSHENQIRARMNFYGTADAGTHVISIDKLKNSLRIASGSTFTFAFTSDNTMLNLKDATFQILLPAGWMGTTTVGTSAPDWASAVRGNGTTSTIALNEKGTLVVRKE